VTLDHPNQVIVLDVDAQGRATIAEQRTDHGAGLRGLTVEAASSTSCPSSRATRPSS
jgi:hypothetical protein